MDTTTSADGAAEPAGAARVRGLVLSAVTSLVAFLLGLVLLYGVLKHGPTGVFRWADIAGGAVASAALVWRRRAPVVLGIVLAVVAAFVASAGAANMFALYAVARYRRLGVAVAVGVAVVGFGVVFWWLYPGNNGLDLTLVVNTAIAAAAIAWGAFRQSQAALIESLQARADRAERERVLEQERIRLAERSRIAREMHDAVAHRVSLIALHAGGLQVAPDPSADDVHHSAGMIRSAAVVALEELRAALGVLRSGESGTLEQPGVDRVGDLVDEANAAGQAVALRMDPAVADVAGAVGRDIHRIVQEGLTNARKHAPGRSARVTIAVVDEEVVVTVRNDAAGASLELPGSGTGLVGLEERVHLAGGTLTHGTTPAGEFELEGRLPWRRQ
ncbi:MAG TPA: histidine kinase [Streptosporangiaceae bacterium]